MSDSNDGTQTTEVHHEAQSSVEGVSLFSGDVGRKYQLLTQATPAYGEMQQIIGKTVAGYAAKQARLPAGAALKVADIGCGNGVTSNAVLETCAASWVVGIDNEPTMIGLAGRKLDGWMLGRRADLALSDAVRWFEQADDGALDVVVSAFTLHNFTQEYRGDLLREVFRVLRPGGLFVNADIYVSDDDNARFNHLLDQLKRIFDVFLEAKEYELLCRWAAHYITDQKKERVMKKGASGQMMRHLGFSDTRFVWEAEMHAVLASRKPE